MLRSFVSWFETHIVSAGLRGLVDAVVGILAFGSVLGALLGGPAVKAGAVVAAILVMLAVFATLIAGRSHGRAGQARNERLITRYCGIIQALRGAPLHIKEWNDTTVIDARGGVVRTIDVLARVVDDETNFFRFRFGAQWAQSERQRSKAKCVVRGQAEGPRYDTTETWLKDGRREVIAHLPSPAKVGADFRILLEITWPGMCEPLVKRRQPDDFLMHYGRDIDLVRYTLVLPEGEEPRVEPIHFREGDNGYGITTKRNSAGLVEVVLRATNVPAKYEFGMRVDLG